MIRTISIPPLRLRRAGPVRPMIVLRIALAAIAVCVAIAPALSAEPLRLRGDVTVEAEFLTLADLAEDVPSGIAGTPLFRAPAPGETGTIQARRIADAASRLGFAVEAGGRAQITVERSARRIGADEIDAAVKQALKAGHGLEPDGVTLALEGGAPTLVVAPDVTDEVVADQLSYDRRTRRMTAMVKVGEATLRVAGVATEVVEVAVLTRALSRGEVLRSTDIAIERRPKDAVVGEAQWDGNALLGRVARRNLTAGSLLRAVDLGKPELVTRGDAVTVVYETPGMSLTLRARASESGGLGDSVAVLNQHSKKTLQAIVIGPGKVSVNPALPSRVAAHTASNSVIER